MTPTLVLASSSPFRRQLLQRLGMEFQVMPPGIDEQRLSGESPGQLARRLAENKARIVAKDFPEALIIGSDQVAFLGHQIFGKPGDHQNAIRQLSQVSGQKINFLTGLCLLNSSSGNIQIEVIAYEVEFRELDLDTIEHYLRKEQPYQSSAAFKAEGLGIILVKKFKGDDPTALIGLPLICLTEMLSQEGVRIP